jgi:hypothetical protein
MSLNTISDATRLARTSPALLPRMRIIHQVHRPRDRTSSRRCAIPARTYPGPSRSPQLRGIHNLPTRQLHKPQHEPTNPPFRPTPETRLAPRPWSWPTPLQTTYPSAAQTRVLPRSTLGAKTLCLLCCLSASQRARLGWWCVVVRLTDNDLDHVWRHVRLEFREPLGQRLE